MHNKKRQNSSGACAQTILELSSCKGGRSYAQSPYLRCMPIGIAHHQDEIIHLAQFPFPLFLYKLHILNTKRKGEANSTWWFFIISLTFEPLLPSPFTFFPKCVTEIFLLCILWEPKQSYPGLHMMNGTYMNRSTTGYHNYNRLLTIPDVS